MREKDGLCAVLFWLNVIAARGQPVQAIVRDHWERYGRDYFTRHDYEDIDAVVANRLIDELRGRLPWLPGQSFAGLDVAEADEFAYQDPVDGSESNQQGLRVWFNDGSRAVLRLSGTGTGGATLRVYFDSYQADPALMNQDTQRALAPCIDAVEEMVGIRALTGREGPDVIT